MAIIGGCLLATSRLAPVSIHLNATVLMVNSQSLGITCIVPRSPDNRGLHYGILDYTDSFVQLDGEDARVTFGPQFFAHMDCGDHLAYCRITRANGLTFRAVQPFVVSGCAGSTINGRHP